jgi:hypothetical protein
MAQIRYSSNQEEALLNIFPNPCIGDTYLYTDDLEAAWVCILNETGQIQMQTPIISGRTLHVKLALEPGTYQLMLQDVYHQVLGRPKLLYISASH